jgi:TPR repeat protein
MDPKHAPAQHDLGVAYEHGAGVVRDPAAAVRWYRKAAEQGCAEAQSSLGGVCLKGEGVVKDPVAAVRWYRKAAE